MDSELETIPPKDTGTKTDGGTDKTFGGRKDARDTLRLTPLSLSLVMFTLPILSWIGKGLRGGKARHDGLVPGSKEAIAADKLYGGLRKWQDRHPGQIHPDAVQNPFCQSFRKNLSHDGKPLPVRAEPGQIPPKLSSDPHSNFAERIVATQKIEEPIPPPIPSVVSPGVSPLPAVCWLVRLTCWTLRGLRWSIGLARTLNRYFKSSSPCSKNGATTSATNESDLENLPPDLVREIDRDSAWNARAVKILCDSGSRVLAKLMNSGGHFRRIQRRDFLRPRRP